MAASDTIAAVSRQLGQCADTDSLEATLQGGIPAIHAALIAAWQDDIQNYEALALDDFKTGFGDFVDLMTRGKTNLFRDGTLATHFNWSDPEFKAHISPVPGQRLNEMQIYMAGGVMRSLDDLLFRAFCNSDFFSWAVEHNDTVWKGCPCYFASLFPSYLRPVVRYWDYHPDIEGFLDAALSGSNPFLGVAPAYYSGFPAGDDERLRAAGFASTVGFYWVLAHEAAHYRRGHFHAMSEHPDWFGIEGSASNIDDHLWMAEGGDRHSAINEDALSRQIEWDADRVATESIIDMFFHPDQAGNLPSYCAGNPRWLFRLVLLGMTSAGLLFDRIAQIRGTGAQHPSGFARIVGIIIAACRRFDQTVGDTAVTDPEIRAFAQVAEPTDALMFAADAVMETLQDLLVVAEILENENVEGADASGYRYPLGNDQGDIGYLHYMTLSTMFKALPEDVFGSLREVATSSEANRWAAPAFAEIKTYLTNEVDHDLTRELDRYAAELHRLHEAKLAQLKHGSEDLT